MLGDTNIAPVIDELHKLFDAYNAAFYHGALPKPVIVLEKAENRVTRSRTSIKQGWAETESKSDLPKHYEITIATEDIGQQSEVLANLLLHECAHLYAIINGEKDTSNGGFFHNGIFKRNADEHGLVCAKVPRHGWADTSLTPEAFIIAADVFNAVSPVYRVHAPENTSSGRKPSSTRKFTCPSCGMKIRVTKRGDVNVICGDCNRNFVEFD